MKVAKRGSPPALKSMPGKLRRRRALPGRALGASARRSDLSCAAALLRTVKRRSCPVARHRAMSIEGRNGTPPPHTSRFGSPLELSRVTWVKRQLVCEVRFLSWTSDGLLRQVAYEGLRADKPAREVRLSRPV
jgi:hypothetical protein